ncbi:MAG: Ig-like domain-containing protein [Candidatus Zixiibacteriota bacterium]
MYNVTFIAHDGVLADSEIVAIEVTDVNRVPVLASISSQSVTEGDTLKIDVTATDPDGDSLTLSAVNLPTNAIFSDNSDGTGSFSFSPDFAQAGAYNVTFIVSDGVMADSEIVAIEVTSVNLAPVLAMIDSQVLFEGDTLAVEISATDPDGDSLILSAENLPTNANFSDNRDGTGRVTFAPDFTQAGVYDVTFVVSDGVLADSEVVAITVVRHDPLTISGNAGVAGTIFSYMIDTTETTTADGSGYYSLTVPYGWSGTVTPSMDGYVFSPASRTYANAISNQTDQDFTASIISDVSQDNGGLIPDEFQLAQNYPNPFNPETAIEYAVASRSPVRIEVFNVLGQCVRVLLDEVKAAGNYQMTWDGTDQIGNLVSTGMYLYRIQAGDFVQTKKMLLLK